MAARVTDFQKQDLSAQKRLRDAVTPPSNEVEKPVTRPRVVILGGGFGGLEAAKVLASAPVDVTVIDKSNHFLFQPLLYQVATASLAPTDISSPIRFQLRKNKNTTVLLADAKNIDVEAKTVIVDDDRRAIPYDYLIVATGARHAYFGHNDWEAFAPGLKSTDDAENVRQRFLLAFEQAEKATTDAERKAWLTFVIVGAGPTGCELSGVIPEIARKAFRDNFRNIDTNNTQVILIEAGPRILPPFPAELAEKAKRDLEKLGVTIRTGSPVIDVNADGVMVKGDAGPIPCHTVFWGAGNQASPLAKDLGAPLDKQGRVIAEKDLSIPGHPEIFVVGDICSFAEPNNKFVPWVAQGAMQQGSAAAKNVLHRLYREETHPFSYFNKGDLAVIGRGKAIANLPFGIKLSGFPAWFIWAFVHILYLAGFRNRLSVLLEWGYAYLTFQRGARLITGKPSSGAPPAPSVGSSAASSPAPPQPARAA